ncbi:MAG: archease [Planctomycetes bacterium]|nr:archease [Planctomycetota bacterium]
MAGTVHVMDHTGDVGIEVRADTREELFRTAAVAMFDLIADVARVAPAREEVIEVAEESDDLRLRSFLAELLYRFFTNGMIFCDFQVSFSEMRLVARARGETFEADRHALRTELKAVTYHGLVVRPDGGGWFARVIFDV